MLTVKKLMPEILQNVRSWRTRLPYETFFIALRTLSSTRSQQKKFDTSPPMDIGMGTKDDSDCLR